MACHPDDVDMESSESSPEESQEDGESRDVKLWALEQQQKNGAEARREMDEEERQALREQRNYEWENDYIEFSNARSRGKVSCKTCRKIFATANRSFLFNHTLVHAGRRPFKCQIQPCPERFRSLANRRNHELKVHKSGVDEEKDPEFVSKLRSFRKDDDIQFIGIFPGSSEQSPPKENDQKKSISSKFKSKNKLSSLLKKKKQNKSNLKPRDPLMQAKREQNREVEAILLKQIKNYEWSGEFNKLGFKSGEFEFECITCKQLLPNATPIQLCFHNFGHTGQTPFSCDFCESNFSSPDLRNQHQKKVHMKKKKKPVQKKAIETPEEEVVELGSPELNLRDQGAKILELPDIPTTSIMISDRSPEEDSKRIYSKDEDRTKSEDTPLDLNYFPVWPVSVIIKTEEDVQMENFHNENSGEFEEEDVQDPLSEKTLKEPEAIQKEPLTSVIIQEEPLTLPPEVIQEEPLLLVLPSGAIQEPNISEMEQKNSNELDPAEMGMEDSQIMPKQHGLGPGFEFDWKTTPCSDEEILKEMRNFDWSKDFRRVKNGKGYQCLNCNKILKRCSRLNLNAHLFRHRSIKPFLCQYCPNKFNTSRGRNLHLKIHLKEIEKLQNSQNSKEIQVETHDSETQSLEESFNRLGQSSQEDDKSPIQTSQEEIQLQFKIAEEDAEMNRRIREYDWKKDWRQLELLYGTKRFECNICKKTIASSKSTNKGNLLHHIFTHSGEKPYSCECKRRFRARGNRDSHRAICSQLKKQTNKAKKPKLDKKQANKAKKPKLDTIHNKDEKIEHKSQRPAIYPCKFCPKMYNNSSHRDDHERFHTGELPYQCTICTKRFRAYSSLYFHKKLHAKNKNYMPRSLIFEPRKTLPMPDVIPQLEKPCNEKEPILCIPRAEEDLELQEEYERAFGRMQERFEFLLERLRPRRPTPKNEKASDLNGESIKEIPERFNIELEHLVSPIKISNHCQTQTEDNLLPKVNSSVQTDPEPIKQSNSIQTETISPSRVESSVQTIWNSPSKCSTFSQTQAPPEKHEACNQTGKLKITGITQTDKLPDKVTTSSQTEKVSNGVSAIVQTDQSPLKLTIGVQTEDFMSQNTLDERNLAPEKSNNLPKLEIPKKKTIPKSFNSSYNLRKRQMGKENLKNVQIVPLKPKENWRDSFKKTRDNRLKCIKCKTIVSLAWGSAHFKSHNKTELFSCSKCSKTFVKPYNLKRHASLFHSSKRGVEIMERIEESCEENPQEFKTDGFLGFTDEDSVRIAAKSKQMTSLVKMIEKNLKREKASSKKSKEGKNVLAQYKSLGGGRYECLECSKIVTRRKKHALTHRGERPYNCRTCSLTFKRIYHRDRHEMAVHTGNKSEKCRHCPLKFNRPHHRDRHEKSVHFGMKRNDYKKKSAT